jgi:hypothetical protein
MDVTAAMYRTLDGVLFLDVAGEPKHLGLSEWDVASVTLGKTTLCGREVAVYGLANYASESKACKGCIAKAGDKVRLRGGREPGQEG